MASVVVVGAGWLGTAIAQAVGTEPIARRHFSSEVVTSGCRLVVASGRAGISGREGLAAPLANELAHLRTVLDAAVDARVERVVVLGSSDVTGFAEVISGTTPQAPRTTYALVKAAVEDECVLRRGMGLPVTCVRLAPVHGPGKQRTRALVRLARRPVVPLPNGGRHSTGFVALPDAVNGVRWLLDNDAPAVQSVGAGHTPLRSLLEALAQAQARPFRSVTVPVPARRVAAVVGPGAPDILHWLVRLASPRLVSMEPPLIPMPLEQAARLLVNHC